MHLSLFFNSICSMFGSQNSLNPLCGRKAESTSSSSKGTFCCLSEISPLNTSSKKMWVCCGTRLSAWCTILWGFCFFFPPSAMTLSFLIKTKSKVPKAVISMKDLNADFQPEKIGHPHGLQISYSEDDHTRNLFVYHDDGQVRPPVTEDPGKPNQCWSCFNYCSVFLVDSCQVWFCFFVVFI